MPDAAFFKKIPPRIGSAVPPLDAAILQALEGASAADVSDIVGPLYTLDPDIGPMAGAARLLGEAFTVKAPPGDNRAILGAMGLVGRGQILVIDWRGYTGACGSGAKALVDPCDRGLAGVLIDGAWRDLDDVGELGLSLFGRGASIYSPVKQHLGEIGVPVCCGGVIVEPGDVIIGDREGVAVIPRRHVADVAALLAQAKTVNDSIEAVRARAEDRRQAFAADFSKAGGLKAP